MTEVDSPSPPQRSVTASVVPIPASTLGSITQDALASVSQSLLSAVSESLLELRGAEPPQSRSPTPAQSAPLRRIVESELVLPAPPEMATEREESETMLIARAQLDDGAAQQEIYRRHAGAVFRRLTCLLGADEEREDLLQQVFSDLFVGLSRFRGDAMLRTYVYRIATNVAYDHLRRRCRRRRIFGGAGEDDEVAERAAEQRSPESMAALQEQLQAVWRYLERLAPKKRIALVLRVCEGLSLEEIGQQVGARVSTVAKRIKYAREELIEMIRRERRRELRRLLK